MKHFDFAVVVAKDEDIAVAEFALFHRFFQSHGTHGDGIVGLHDVSFGGAHRGGEAVDYDRHGGGGIGPDGHGSDAFRLAGGDAGGPFLLGRALAGADAALVLDRLAVNAVKSFTDGGHHLGGLGHAYDGMIAHGDGDLRFVAVLFHGENHMSIEVIAQDFSDLDEAVLDLLADCGSDFVLPSGVLHVHRTPSLVGGGNRCSEWITWRLAGSVLVSRAPPPHQFLSRR